jgi:hypothetical protein
MLTCAPALAHMVPAPQVFSSSPTSNTSAAQPAMPDMSHTGKVDATPAMQQPAHSLAFANFGQWDESSSEN